MEWNTHFIFSVVVEWALLVRIYRKYPALAKKPNLEEDAVEDRKRLKLVRRTRAKEDHEDERVEYKGKRRSYHAVLEPRTNSILDNLLHSLSSWWLYFNHKIRDAGLGLALIFMTVLGEKLIGRREQ